MRVVFHYAGGPALAARLAALPGLEVAVCPEHATPWWFPQGKLST